MDNGGVATCLATISVVLAAVVFPAENARTGPMQFIERYLGFSPAGRRSAGGNCRCGRVSAGDEVISRKSMIILVIISNTVSRADVACARLRNQASAARRGTSLFNG